MGSDYGIRQHAHRGQRVGGKFEYGHDKGTHQCWRCGVDFDPAGFKPGAPCPDCQLDSPDDWSLSSRTKGGKLSEAEKQARIDEVKHLHSLNFMDREIERMSGIPRGAVAQIRKQLGLPVVFRPDMHMWKDQDAQIAHMRAVGQSEHKRGKGRRPFNMEGSGPRW